MATAHLVSINLTSPRDISPRHNAVNRGSSIGREPNSRTTPHILEIHTARRIGPINESLMEGISVFSTLPIAAITIVLRTITTLLLFLPHLLALPIRRVSNHCGYRDLLWGPCSASQPSEGRRSEVVLLLGVVEVHGYGLIVVVVAVIGWKSREKERRNGGFAPCGLNYRWDFMWVWICFRNELAKLASGSSQFDVFRHCWALRKNRHGFFGLIISIERERERKRLWICDQVFGFFIFLFFSLERWIMEYERERGRERGKMEKWRFLIFEFKSKEYYYYYYC